MQVLKVERNVVSGVPNYTVQLADLTEGLKVKGKVTSRPWPQDSAVHSLISVSFSNAENSEGRCNAQCA